MANRPPANTSFDGYASAELADPLASAVQGLHIGSNNPFRNTTSASTASNYNPFHPNDAAAANPFLDPRSRPASARPSRETPGYATGGYARNGGGGFLDPGQGNALQHHDRRGSRGSQTPAFTSSRERNGDSQHRPSSVAQPRQREREKRNTFDSGLGSSSRSSAQASVLPTTACNGMKLTRSMIKAKFTRIQDFKAEGIQSLLQVRQSGYPRIVVSTAHILQVFKAFYNKTDETNNPFGEMLPFVVVRPSKHHSICFVCHQLVIFFISHSIRAIQTYRGRGTTAAHARTRDHMVIYTGDQPPTLLEGESDSIYNRRPIQVALDPKGEPLHPSSRLNVAKFVTIEHDTPIAKLGKISIRDVERLRQYSGVSTSMYTQALDDLDEDEDEDDAYR